jgi:hypothetical protein
MKTDTQNIKSVTVEFIGACQEQKHQVPDVFSLIFLLRANNAD